MNVFSNRSACFAILLGSTLAAFWAPLSRLIRFSFQQEHYSHIILIPLLSAAVFSLERKRIFSHVETRWGPGLGLLLAGTLFYWFGRRDSASPSENDQLSIAMLCIVVVWIGAFVLCYGLRTLRAGLFPALFLFLMVPIPDSLLNQAISSLQTGSAEVTDAAFQLLGVPVLRTGFIFLLPGVTIEVSKECSGIRSSLALLIMSLLAGHLFLRSVRTKAVLILATLPLIVLKNGVRIVTLSLLSIYVDPRFLTGSLHRDGGILFFLFALTLMAPVLLLLQKSEAMQGQHDHPTQTPLRERTRARVCVVAYTFYAYDNRVRRYAETLAKRGDEVDVIALRRRGRPPVEVISGIRVFQIQRREINERHRLTYLFRLALFFMRSTALLTTRHLRRPYDLFHIHSVPDFLVFTAWLPKLMGAKVILDIHDLLPEFYADKFRTPRNSLIPRFLVAVERASAAFADHVIVANHPWRDKLLSRSIRDPQKCTTILNFPDASIFFRRGLPKTNSKFVILYPGSLNHHQGVDLAIRAFALIRNDAPNAEFHIYGEGDQKAFLKDLIGTLGLENRVFLNEIVPLTEIATVMEAADVGVVPKRKESFGNEAFSTKILEFMSVGVPVIVSDTEIDKYYFDESIVKFFRSSDEKDLAHGMLLLIQNAELRRRLAANAEAFIKTNTWEVKKTEYLELVDHRLIAHGSKSETP